MISLKSVVSFISVQSLSCVWLFATLWIAAHQASLSITKSQSLLNLRSIEQVMLSNHLVLWCPLLLLPSIFASIRGFSNESELCIRWPKYWSFSISPSSTYSGLISFRNDWFDLLAVQGTVTLFFNWRNMCWEVKHLPEVTAPASCSAWKGLGRGTDGGGVAQNLPPSALTSLLSEPT